MQRIKASVRNTWSNNVLSDVGHFGGLFSVPDSYREPVLVSSMDGVGTKLLVASRAGRFDTVGQDLVNHCVNDILVQGAKPLFFLDYLAAGSLEPQMVAGVVEGLARACSENGCALIGGETAEMPGVYHGDDFDLAGTIVGVVERTEVIDGSAIEPGHVLLALPSNGLHTNGYSLVRRVVFDHLGLDVTDEVEVLGCSIADELLRVHRSYLAPVDAIASAGAVKGLAHITGGGVVENLPRVLPEGCGARIEKGAWPVPPVFTWLAEAGEVPEGEMFRVFNMGLGMIVVVEAETADAVGNEIADAAVYRVGEIVKGDSSVELV
jgi:phosphoribosylformylglycinamidine cyclo-ligase